MRGGARRFFLCLQAFGWEPVPLRPRGAPERSALAVAVSRALGHHFDAFWGYQLTLVSATAGALSFYEELSPSTGYASYQEISASASLILAL